MRTLKSPDVRRAEILDMAESLFTTKGYGKTTIMDILTALGIAKGTFYYYFKSKEEVMDAVIARMAAAVSAAAEEIAGHASLSPTEKLILIFTSGNRQDAGREKMLEQIHGPGNGEMHLKSLAMGIKSLTPILASIVQQGVADGIYHTPYPGETMEFLLVCGQFLFDGQVFHMGPEERAQKAKAFVAFMESALGAKAGTFAAMEPVLLGNDL